MRRNDPFIAPAAALARNGEELPRSQAKWHVLFPPARDTGVPLGGIGTGGIMRSSEGVFSRWTIKGGGVKQFSLPSAGFVLRTTRDGAAPKASALQPEPDTDEMSAFEFVGAADHWHGLFPKAWHHYRADRLDGVEVACMSFSPVIPGNLDAASLPVALFQWRLTNAGADRVETALAFLFPNLNGWFVDFGEARPERPATGTFNRAFEAEVASGIVLDRARAGDLLPESTGRSSGGPSLNLGMPRR